MLVGILPVLLGFVVLGQGCTDVDGLVRAPAREGKLSDQYQWARAELRKGNLESAKSLFEWIGNQSDVSSLRDRAQLFHALTVLLDKEDEKRWEQGRRMLAAVGMGSPDSEFGEIASHFATALSEVAMAAENLENENISLQQQIDLAGTKTQEMDQLLQKQKRQLSEQTTAVEELRSSLLLRDKEIRSLELKIQKLEEIHKEIKEKRKGLS
jgi:chromosome segregation ATPase